MYMQGVCWTTSLVTGGRGAPFSALTPGRTLKFRCGIFYPSVPVSPPLLALPSHSLILLPAPLLDLYTTTLPLLHLPLHPSHNVPPTTSPRIPRRPSASLQSRLHPNLRLPCCHGHFDSVKRYSPSLGQHRGELEGPLGGGAVRDPPAIARAPEEGLEGAHC